MTKNKKMKKGMSSKQIFSIVTAVITLLANIAVAALIFMSMQYSGLDTGLFFSVFGAIVCVLIIADIIFFVGFNHRDQILKIITCVLTVILFIGGSIGIYYISRVNRAVGNLVQSGDGETYETIRVVYATYDNSSITAVEGLDGKDVGSLSVSGVSAASVGREYLEEQGIEPSYKTYNMTSELFEALVDGEIDAAIFPNTYRSQLSSEEGFEDLLADTVDIYSFEKEVATGNSETSSIDISVEPFNILLIGYAPEPGGGGLTDTIIVASVNPQTMSATMVSIPRDSYVPISCYNNAESKINDAGAASRQCLMDTVGNLLELDIDFYMEVNFQGLVDIVDALGGIYINSPVEFVGQSPSSNRGEMTVWVPAGEILANGEQALAFARERHAMPNGDFDRQVHQQEVISEIVRKFMDLTDINQALAVMDAAGENFTTNLSISQLTSIFNYLLTAPNYTGMPQFNMLDIKMSRVTGYTRWFYSYSMRLPLWSYYLWEGSIRDNVELLDETLGEYDSINQDSYFKFFIEYPYNRSPLYYEYYDEPMIPEDMPAYYPYLTDLTYDEAMAWAEANGVTLEVTVIEEGQPGYDANAIGTVVSQFPAYGQLVSDYPTGSITVIGSPLSEEDKVPNFVGGSISAARDWANANGYSINETVEANSDMSKAGQVISQSVAAGSDKSKYNSIDITYYEIPTISVGELDGGIGRWTKAEIEAWMSKMGISTSPNYTYYETNDYAEGVLIDYSVNTPVTTGSSFTFILATPVKVEPSPTPTPTPTTTTSPSPTPTPTTPPDTSESPAPEPSESTGTDGGDITPE